MNNQFIQNLLTQKTSLLEQIKLIDAMLVINGVNPEQSSLLDEQGNNNCPYKKSDNYQQKIAALLKHSNRFLTISELASMVNRFEPTITIEEAKKGLGSAKNMLLKSNAIVKHQVGTNNSNTFYGSPSWINDDSTIKPEYMYDENALQVKPLITI